MPFAEIDRCQLYYEYRPALPGQETLVFCNGIMSPLESWDPQMPLMEKLGYGVLRWEYRGQWRSQRSPETFGFADMAADLAALLDICRIGRAHLCGTSYGGFLGLRFALDHPKRIRSLLLLTTTAHFTPQTRAVMSNWRRWAAEGDLLRLLEGMLPDLFSPRLLTKNPGAAAARETDMAVATADLPDFLDGQVDLYDTCLREFAENPLLPRLEEIGCPTTIAAGEYDRIFPVACSRAIAERISGAELLVAADGAHAMVFEQPRLVNRLLAGHLLSQNS